jgi:TM2 domain-containing membrane protein YozV
MGNDYWISVGSESKGPYTHLQLQTMWGSGAVTADTLYCQEGANAWLPLSNLLDPQPGQIVTAAPAQRNVESEKRILPALILCLFLGVFGVHAFYAGRKKQGLAMLACLFAPVIVIALIMRSSNAPPSWVSGLFSLTLLAPVFVLVHAVFDLVRILVGAYRDGAGLKIAKWT